MSEVARSPSISPLSFLFFCLLTLVAYGESTSTSYYLSFLRFVLASLPPKTRSRATFVWIFVSSFFFFPLPYLVFFSHDTHIIISPFGYVSRAYTYNLDTFAFLFISIVEPEQLIFNIVMQEFLGILCQSGSVLELSANRMHLLLLLFVPQIIRIPTE